MSSSQLYSPRHIIQIGPKRKIIIKNFESTLNDYKKQMEKQEEKMCEKETTIVLPKGYAHYRLDIQSNHKLMTQKNILDKIKALQFKRSKSPKYGIIKRKIETQTDMTSNSIVQSATPQKLNTGLKGIKAPDSFLFNFANRPNSSKLIHKNTLNNLSFSRCKSATHRRGLENNQEEDYYTFSPLLGKKNTIQKEKNLLFIQGKQAKLNDKQSQVGNLYFFK